MEETTPSSGPNSATAKRPRTSKDLDAVADGDDSPVLPLDLFLLSIPFLSSGDLTQIAGVNKACRDAAWKSYHKRLQTPLESQQVNQIPLEPIIYEHQQIPLCYRKENPWSHDHFAPRWSFRPRDRTGSIMGVQWYSADGTGKWTVTVRLGWERQQYGLRHPKELQTSAPEKATLVHCCVLPDGKSLLAIATRTISLSGRDPPGDSQDRDSAKELWGIVYNLDGESTQKEGELNPALAQELLEEPRGREWTGHYDTGIYYGHTTLSGNGKVMAIISDLPDEEYVGGYQPAEVTLFDITDQGFTQRCEIQIKTFESDFEASCIKPSLSNGGEFLSILSDESHKDVGSWSVYDLRGGGTTCQEPIFQVKGFAKSNNGNHAYFNPDNDFVFHMHQRNDGLQLLKQRRELPRFARQLVLCVGK